MQYVHTASRFAGGGEQTTHHRLMSRRFNGHLQQLGVAYPYVYCSSHPVLIDVQNRGTAAGRDTSTFVFLQRRDAQPGESHFQRGSGLQKKSGEHFVIRTMPLALLLSLCICLFHPRLATGVWDSRPRAGPGVEEMAETHIRRRMASSISERRSSSFLAASPFCDSGLIRLDSGGSARSIQTLSPVQA